MNAGNRKILVFAVRVAEIPSLSQAVATLQRSCFRRKATGVSTDFCGDTKNSFPLPILSFRESIPLRFPTTQRIAGNVGSTFHVTNLLFAWEAANGLALNQLDPIATTSPLLRNCRTEPEKTLRDDTDLGFIRFLTMSRQARFPFTLKNNSLRRTVFTKVGEIFSKLSFEGLVFCGNRD